MFTKYILILIQACTLDITNSEFKESMKKKNTIVFFLYCSKHFCIKSTGKLSGNNYTQAKSHVLQNSEIIQVCSDQTVRSIQTVGLNKNAEGSVKTCHNKLIPNHQPKYFKSEFISIADSLLILKGDDPNWVVK